MAVAAFGSSGPAAIFTLDDVAGWRKCQLVTPISGAAYFSGGSFPYGVVVVVASDYGVGDFVEDGIFDVRFGGVTGEFKRDGYSFSGIVAASGPAGRCVETKSPVRQSVFFEHFVCESGDLFKKLLVPNDFGAGKTLEACIWNPPGFAVIAKNQRPFRVGSQDSSGYLRTLTKEGNPIALIEWDALTLKLT